MIRTTPKRIAKLVEKNFIGSQRAVRNAGLAAAHRGHAMIRNHTPSDTEQLSNSWRVKNQMRGAGGRFVKTQPKIAVLMNDAPHAGIVEMGARPHKVSPEGWWAIYEWVERHFPEASDEDGMVDAYGHDPGFSRITWAIVRKIGREGQKPTHFVRNKLPTFTAQVTQEVGRAMAKHANKMNGSK